jgi:hypothetical protein
VSGDVVQQVRSAVKALGADADQTLSDLGDATEAVTAAADDARRLAALGQDSAAAAALVDADKARAARRTVADRMSAIEASVVEQVQQLVAAEIDPCLAESDIPLLLLPVRIETRYTDDRTALRVRIYPDDIHVDKLDRGVSSAEEAAGKAYWNALWTGAQADTEAWNALLQAIHPTRAAWVAFALTPTNLAARPDPPAAAPSPTFPTVMRRAKAPPAARALPDRFVVVADQGGQTTTATGQPVPPRVVVGLGGGDDPSSLVTSGSVTLGAGMTWMTDFAEAESMGLAVTVTLAQAGAPVDSLLVFGVRGSLEPAAAVDEVSQLLLSHLYSDGFAFLAQGTPTNNTETDRAAWTARPAPAQPSTRVGAAVDEASNVAVLSSALGLDPSLLAAADGASLKEQELAGAANTALWSATWGSFFDRILADSPGHGPDDAQREAVRDQFQDHVRGRGPLPAVRVGNQPYGVLPASSVQSNWVPDGDGPIATPLTALVRRLWGIWEASLSGVPSIQSGAPLDDTLLEILGSAPQMIGLRVRSILSQSACAVVPPLLGVTVDDTDVQQSLDLIVWGTLGLPPDVVGLAGALSKTTRPLGLPLVDDNDPAYIAALLANGNRTISSVLQALLELAYSAEQRAVQAASPPENAQQLLDLGAAAAGDLATTAGQVLTNTVEGKGDAVEQTAIAADLTERFGWTGPVALAKADPIAGVRGSLSSIALQPRIPAKTASTFALQTLGAWFRANARLGQVRDGLEVLASATTAQRQVAVAETLDCASHRLDAWATSLVWQRGSRLRDATPQGVMLGAYGFVENVSPGSGAERDGGYVLAPSLSHAAAAGVLRSAYLTHNPDASGDNAFAVDLSSARIRSALELVEGIRNGQPLGALLGYSFERQLHESPLGLDRFILSIRALAPLVAGKLTDRAEAPPQQAREAVSAANVVDGVGLLALRTGGTDICAALRNRPANNPYLDPNVTWTGPDAGQCAAINAALDDMAAAYDAAADLLLSESVYHLVQGNATRSSAALDSLGGDALPSDPDVARVPSRGAAITHRVLHLSRDIAKGTGGWSTTTPRALAEPRLARWAEVMLGPANRIVVQAAPNGTFKTLAGAGLAAIDFIYDAPVGPVLRQRVRRAMPRLRPGPLARRRNRAWPPGLRAFGEMATYAAALERVLAKAQPALPPAFARPGDQPERQILPADVDDLKTRVTAAATALGSALDALTTALAAMPLQPGAVAAAVDELRAFGVAIPTSKATDTVSANALLADAGRRHDAALAALAASPFGATDGITAAKAIFGDSFWALPVVSPGAPDLFGSRLGRIRPAQSRIRRFLRDVASVRAGLGPYVETMLLGDALGGSRRLHIAQLAASGTPGTKKWLALPFDMSEPSPDLPVASVVVDGPADLTAADGVAGLLLDEWLEVVPQRIERPDGAGGTVREAVVTAGVAVNTATPGARAPQAVLLAVSPDGAPWSTNALADVLRETLLLAKLRTVTLERALWAGRVLPALYEQSWSLQGEETLDIQLLARSIGRPEAMIPFVKESS